MTEKTETDNVKNNSKTPKISSETSKTTNSLVKTSKSDLHTGDYFEIIKDFAIIETGGKQYKVYDGAILDIDRVSVDSQEKIIFDHVLLKCIDNKTTVGTPYLKNYSIEGKILSEIKDPKIIVFKFKRKTGYKKTQGHRQKMVTVKVEKI
jgi:large subunit ribosomal protein L21